MKILAGARIAGTGCRLFRSRKSFSGELRDALSAALPPGTVDWGDFRRGGAAVKCAMLAAAAVRLDLGEAADPAATGVLGWNGAGCACENARFWRDCRANGGAGRGGLFVGTLHSIPVCEAAIALGWHGAAGYLAGNDWRRAAEDFLGAYRLTGVLMMELSGDEAAALLLTPGEGKTGPEGRCFRDFCKYLAEHGLPEC